MKRKFKRIASLVLAMVMVFAMAMPAMAADSHEEPGTNKTITITDAGEGHIFKAYQIFTGVVYDADGKDDHNYETTAGRDEILSNIKWGTGLTGAGQKALAAQLGLSETASAAEVADKLAGQSSAKLEEIFKVVTGTPDNLGTATDSAAPTEDGGNYVISGLLTGYYLVIDTAADPDKPLPDDGNAYSSYIVEVVDNATVKTKAQVPESHKFVKDINDTTKAPTEWDKSADYDIGDHVQFKLTGKVADNYAVYNSYSFEFVDTLSKGLTYVTKGGVADSYQVYIGEEGGTPLTQDQLTGLGFDLVGPAGTGTEGETTLTFKFANLKGDTAKTLEITAGTVIRIEYTATLNDAAVMGNPGNTNKMHLVYSNNPEGDGTGTTPEEEVFVFTFSVDIEKINDENNPLEGAEFTLQKYYGGNTWTDIAKLTGEDFSKSHFIFKGIDDGIYKLTETKTPDGYNTLDPKEVYIKVEAAHDAEGKVTSLTAKVGTWVEGTGFVEDTKAAEVVILTSDKGEKDVVDLGHVGSFGVLSSRIKNNKGTTLPETGGIGTTIFYVVGSVLVLGAVILLVTKRRMKG